MRVFKVKTKGIDRDKKSIDLFRGNNRWVKKEKDAKLYVSPGKVKTLLSSYKQVKDITIEVLEVNKLGEMPVEAFREEFK